jgi:hypothetical protein
MTTAHVHDSLDLREHVQGAILTGRERLGHLRQCVPHVDLADYVHPGAPALPAAVHRSDAGFEWGALLNDTIGDCGEAMPIHGIEAMHLDVGSAPPAFANEDAEFLYEKVGGYVPGNPATDQGTDNGVLVEYWTEEGVLCHADGSIHRIIGTAGVSMDTAMIQRAIWEFVVLFRAIDLPITAQGQSQWEVMGDPATDPEAAVGSWGGHDIPYLSYDGQRYRCISWGQELLVAVAFDITYAMQGSSIPADAFPGFVVVTEDMADDPGQIAPSGVMIGQLVTDLKGMN